MVSVIEVKDYSMNSKESHREALSEASRQGTVFDEEELTLMTCSISFEDASNSYLEDEMKLQIHHEGSFLSLNVDVSASNIVCHYSILIFGLTTFFGILCIITLLTLIAAVDLEEISWLKPFLQSLLFVQGGEASSAHLRGYSD